MKKGRIAEMLGIEYPVFQGGMAWIADAQLAAAVSNAGGLGIIAAGNADGTYVREQIKKAKELGISIFTCLCERTETVQFCRDHQRKERM